MAKLRDVGLWPFSGAVDRPWSDEPEIDAIVRSARRVCQGFSRALVEGDVHARSSELRLLPHVVDREGVLVTVFTDLLEAPESARLEIPRGLHLADPADRARLALDVVHGAVRRLVQARGGEPEAVDHLRERVQREELRFVWTGPAKIGPGRRHVAEPRFEVADDGFGRARILVRRRDDAALVAVSVEGVAASTWEGFKRASRTLRWRGPTRVDLVPFSDWLGNTGGVISVDLPSSPDEVVDEPPGVTEPVPAGVSYTAVQVEGRGASAPEGHLFPEWIQGGALHHDLGCSPRGFAFCLGATIELMAASPDWLAWWEPAGAPGVHVTVWLPLSRPFLRYDLPRLLGADGAVTTRRHRDRIDVHCRSTLPQTRGTRPEVTEWVRTDLARIVDRLGSRYGLGDPPEVLTLRW